MAGIKQWVLPIAVTTIYTPEPKQCLGNTFVIPDELLGNRRQRNVEATAIGSDGERWCRMARIFDLTPALAT